MKINIEDVLAAWVQLDSNALAQTEGAMILINYEMVIRNIHLTHAAKLKQATFKWCHFITNRISAEVEGVGEQWDEMVKTGAYSVRVTPTATAEN